MYKNYFRTALRNLLRHKFYSAINILGLATGIACFIFIFMFIQDEVRYDRFHSKADRIYRFAGKIDMEGQGEESSSAVLPAARALKTDYPHLIQEAVRFFNFQQPTLTLERGENKFNEKRLFFADSAVFRVFDFTLQKGNPEKALAAPNSIVISPQLAAKHFGTADPMGQVLKLEGFLDLKVTGVFEELPTQSHILFDGLISMGTVARMTGPNFEKNWVWNPAWTYILLQEGVQPAELEKQFPAFIDKYYPDFIKPQISHYLQPLTSIHLYSHLDYEIAPNGDAANLYIFGAIGLFIILIACINFMNLATARAAGRAKEVGVRKAAGAHRSQLIRQFLSEAILLSFVAVILALALIELLLPVFNNLSGKSMSVDLIHNPALLAGLIGIGMLTGLVSGLYPAFFLSRFEPAKVLKGNTKTGNASARLRKGLVVLQFAVSIALIISTAVIYLQLHYLRSASLGFNKDQVVVVPLRPPVVSKLEAMQETLLADKNIVSITSMNEILGQNHNTHEFNYEGMQPDKWIYFPALIVNEDFIPTFDLKLVAGRNFSEEFPRDDSTGIIINEAMVKQLGWGSPEQAIGKRFDTPAGNEKVIGVVKDFNFVSLTQPIGPFVLDMPHKKHSAFWKKYMAVRVAPGDMPKTLAHLEKTWDQFVPQFPFEYFFLDDRLEQQYAAQDNLARLVGYFSVLAILIACLGLFALASFTAEQRTKEIGIRKVLGASVPAIVYLLTKDFVKLVVVASVIAFPLAWYAMHKWLENFAYRVPMPVWVFVFAGFLGLLIAVLTVSYQAVKAAYANPVKSLKYE